MMDASEQQALSDTDQFGFHVIHVLGEDKHPPFAYSVGIRQTSNAPELLVVGLKQPLAHFVVNAYDRRIRLGETVVDGRLANDFLEGFDCLFRLVGHSHYREYLGWNSWLYRGEFFDVLQLIYLDTSELALAIGIHRMVSFTATHSRNSCRSVTLTANPALNAEVHRRAFSPPAVAG